MVKRLIIFLGSLSLLAAVTLVGFGYYFWQEMQKPLNIPQEGMVYQLKEGTSIRTLADNLHQKDIVKNSWYLEVWARWIEPGADIRAGEYKLSADLTIAELLQLFRSGHSLQHKFTVLEGSRFSDFATQLEKMTKKGMIKAKIESGEYHQQFIELTGVEHPEGWVFPDTYYYSRGDSDQALMMRAYRKMQQTLDSIWKSSQPNLPIKTPYEALILASIIEKESGAVEERPTIAGVFIRRLRQGMKLQTDPTVIYGMGDRYTGNIRKSDLKRDTEYNTYTRKGLPPTPIALPSAKAIQAAVQPDDTGALFFVAKGGGRHHFSKTYKEHREAVIKYLLGGNASRYKGDS